MGLGQRPDHEALDGHALVDPLYHRQAEITAHQAGHHDLAAARDHGNRERHRLLVAGEIDDLVEAALGFPDDALDDIRLRRDVYKRQSKDLIGARKAVFPWIGCGQCRDCANGDENLCVKQRFLGVSIDGGFASHVLVPDAKYLLDYDPLPVNQAATLMCSGVTAYGALKRLVDRPRQRNLLLIGLGGVGMIDVYKRQGEDGSLGTEDQNIVAPAVETLRSQGIEVRGPLPADTMFHAAARKTYDCAICMYHDQALIPIKTIAFDDAVNVTLGLPFIRTSPDHGTAFDIAGTGRANPSSLIAALRLAARMAATQPA